MRALVHHGPGDVRLEEVPTPSPGSDEVIVKPLVAGICSSDRHAFDGRPFGRQAWRRGLVLGHEFSGVVSEVGSDVTEPVVGDRVSVDPRLPCDRCPNCYGGLETLCLQEGGWLGVGEGPDGGLADACAVRASRCHTLPDQISDAAAALVEPLASPVRAARHTPVAPGDHVAIVGADDYALLLLQLLLPVAERTVVMDSVEVRRVAAQELGATKVFDSTGSGLARKVRQELPAGADVVFVSMEDHVEASVDHLALAHRLARVQGTVVILRSYGSAPYAAVDPAVPYMKELTIRHFGAFFGSEPIRGGRERGDWRTALRALATGTVSPPPGTMTVPFGDLAEPDAPARLMNAVGVRATKVLVDISSDSSAQTHTT